MQGRFNLIYKRNERRMWHLSTEIRNKSYRREIRLSPSSHLISDDGNDDDNNDDDNQWK